MVWYICMSVSMGIDNPKITYCRATARMHACARMLCVVRPGSALAVECILPAESDSEVQRVAAVRRTYRLIPKAKGQQRYWK